MATKRSTAVFHIAVAVGLVVALSLWVFQIVDKPAVRLGEERVGRDGLVATAQVLARNHSARHDYCVEVRIVALSRSGFDIAEVAAEPTRGGGRIRPGQTVNFVGVFDELTEEDYRESIDEFRAFVERSRRC